MYFSSDQGFMEKTRNRKMINDVKLARPLRFSGLGFKYSSLSWQQFEKEKGVFSPNEICFSFRDGSKIDEDHFAGWC